MLIFIRQLTTLYTVFLVSHLIGNSTTLQETSSTQIWGGEDLYIRMLSITLKRSRLFWPPEKAIRLILVSNLLYQKKKNNYKKKRQESKQVGFGFLNSLRSHQKMIFYPTLPVYFCFSFDSIHSQSSLSSTTHHSPPSTTSRLLFDGVRSEISPNRRDLNY